MLDKFILPEMGKIFSRENRYQLMTDVTVLTCEALADIGHIPKEAYYEIKDKARFDADRIDELEAETLNNSVAFLSSLSENIGPASRYLQMGVCSVDITDTVTSLQIKQASEFLQGRINQLREVLTNLAHEYKYTLMMGRTHGNAAEPITFGLKMALWIRQLDRDMNRLRNATTVATVGLFSGNVGSFSSVDPHVETFVCRRLGLHAAFVTSQALQRDRMAEFMSTLAIVGASLEQFATEIRNLERTEIHEVEENTKESGDIGSYSLPHKRRPYKTEVICGLARVLRGNALAAMESIAMWHEYDASHNQTEHITLPDSCILLDYMLWSFTDVMQHLKVNPEQMRHNIDRCFGLVFSQRVLMALMDKGAMKEEAYDLVERNAKAAWEQQADFQFLLMEDEDVREYLTHRDIMELFDYDIFRKHIDYVFARADI